MRTATKRVLHIIRHAESELNVFSAHANAGYFEGVTGLDAKLSDRGIEQSKELGLRVSNENDDDPYVLKQAQLIVTSPLSRSILTALHSMPTDKYKYAVRREIVEQVENTTDIGHHKSDLAEMYPQISHAFSHLPDAWWWQHPERHNLIPNLLKNNSVNGASKQYSDSSDNSSNDSSVSSESSDNTSDASLLISLRGKSPASEPKYNVRQRCFNFIEGLYNDNEMINLTNIAAFSHACTIRELEMLLLSLNGQMNDDEAIEWGKDDTIRNNTEQITFDLPLNKNEVDWDLLKKRVMLAKDILNHADLEE